MTAARLTRSIREAILKKLLVRAFGDQAQDFVNRASAFAVEVYEDALSEHIGKIAALPKDWLPTSCDIKVMMGGSMTRLCFNGSMGHGSLPSELLLVGARDAAEVKHGSPSGSFGRVGLPYPHKLLNQCVKQYEASHPLALAAEPLSNELADLKLKVSGSRNAANAALESVTTVKKLIEVWPEVEEFAKHYLDNGDRKALLPAVPRAALNVQLGLPPTERVEVAA